MVSRGRSRRGRVGFEASASMMGSPRQSLCCTPRICGRVLASSCRSASERNCQQRSLCDADGIVETKHTGLCISNGFIRVTDGFDSKSSLMPFLVSLTEIFDLWLGTARIRLVAFVGLEAESGFGTVMGMTRTVHNAECSGVVSLSQSLRDKMVPSPD